MPDTFTPALNLNQPEVGGSFDTWVPKLNNNNSIIDGLFEVSTGRLKAAKIPTGYVIGTDIQAQNAKLQAATALSGALVGTTDAQTLTNKTITAPLGIVKGDVGLGNVDNTSDATKNAAVATLTNKTITTPVITAPTGIVKGDVGLGNVDNTSDATKNSAVATLTNKTMSGANNTFSNIPLSAVTGAPKQADQQIFTSSGTWTKPSGFGAKAYVLIECWGAGGGGGRTNAGTGVGGGGGGAYKYRWVLLSSLGSTESVGIGAGGTGRTGTAGNGTVGGSTTFGAHVIAYGGGPGGSTNGTGGTYFAAGDTGGSITVDMYTGGNGGTPVGGTGGSA